MQVTLLYWGHACPSNDNLAQDIKYTELIASLQEGDS
jgi:hypothetical protein